MKILASFKQHLEQLIPDLEGSKLLVATSGGSDSLALCFLLKELNSNEIFSFHSIIIDHRLRPESSEEAQKVNNLLNSKGINANIIEWIAEKPKSNIQEEARIARYDLLTNYCKINKFDYILTGHQKNDQAENFLIRLEHGSGLYGLSGIAEKCEINNVKIIRPLLNFDKEELREYLIAKNIQWVDDPSNENEKYTRVRIRKFLQSKPYLTDKLVNATKNLNKAREVIEFYVNKFIEENIIFIEKSAVFDISNFNEQPQEIRFRVLNLLLEKINRPLSKLACAEEFEGGSEHRTGMYKEVHEDSSTELTCKLPTEVEFQKRSNSHQQKIRGERIDNLLNKLALGKEFTAATLGKCLIRRKKQQIIITKENNSN